MSENKQLSPLTKPDAVYFDVDGVLLFTRNTYAAVKDYLQEKGVELPVELDTAIAEHSKLLREKAGMHNDDDILEATFLRNPEDPHDRITLTAALANLLKAKSIVITKREIDVELRQRRQEKTNYSAYDSAAENIQKLREAGVKVGFITTAPNHIAKEQLLEKGLMKEGDVLFTGDDGVGDRYNASGEEVGSANKKKFIEAAVMHDGITPGKNIWYVGDRPEDAADTVRAGATAIHFGPVVEADLLANSLPEYLPAIAEKYGTGNVAYTRVQDHAALAELLSAHLDIEHAGPLSEKAAHHITGWKNAL